MVLGVLCLLWSHVTVHLDSNVDPVLQHRALFGNSVAMLRQKLGCCTEVTAARPGRRSAPIMHKLVFGSTWTYCEPPLLHCRWRTVSPQRLSSSAVWSSSNNYDISQKRARHRNSILSWEESPEWRELASLPLLAI